MIERIRKKYAMTEKGTKDYVAAATDTLSRLIGETPVLRLDCLPDESAVKVLEECL